MTKYRTLILSAGRHGDALMADMIFSHEDGADTPEELLEGFVTTLRSFIMVELVGEVFEGDYNASPLSSHCRYCHTEFIHNAQYCHQCGTRRLDAEPITQEYVNDVAAQRFLAWFGQKLHQFRDYEALNSVGWEFGMAEGGFVRVENFEEYILTGNMAMLLMDASLGEVVKKPN